MKRITVLLVILTVFIIIIIGIIVGYFIYERFDVANDNGNTESYESESNDEHGNGNVKDDTNGDINQNIPAPDFTVDENFSREGRFIATRCLGLRIIGDPIS